MLDRQGDSLPVCARSYTLGGLYLARYTDSPAGAFDEVSLSCYARALLDQW